MSGGNVRRHGNSAMPPGLQSIETECLFLRSALAPAAAVEQEHERIGAPASAQELRLSIHSQRDLDKIAESLNTRPRAVPGFRTPLAVFAEECAKPEAAA